MNASSSSFPPVIPPHSRIAAICPLNPLHPYLPHPSVSLNTREQSHGVFQLI